MKRDETVDVVRGIGILLVVFGHNWITVHEKALLFRVIYSFHVPLFFFLSGVFLSPSVPFRSFVRSRAAALLKPYFVVMFAVTAQAAVHNLVVGKAVYPAILMQLVNVAYATGNLIPWSPMWFLPSLFVSSVACFLIVALLPGRGRLPALVVAAGLLIMGHGVLVAIHRNGVWLPGWTGPDIDGLPWSIDLLPITSAFALAGYAVGGTFKAFKVNWLLAGVLLALFVVLQIAFVEPVDLNFREYGNVLICTAEAISGIYLCFAAASLLKRSQILAWAFSEIGKRSLFILIFHPIVQYSVFSALRKHEGRYLSAWVGFAAACLIPLVLFELVKRSSVLSMLFFPAPRREKRRAQVDATAHTS